MKRFVVLKFGGTSVARIEAWRTIAGEIRKLQAEDVVPIVVASALAGVTNGLEEVIAAAGEGDAAEAVRRVRGRHEAFASELGVDPALLVSDLDELDRVAVGASLVG